MKRGRDAFFTLGNYRRPISSQMELGLQGYLDGDDKAIPIPCQPNKEEGESIFLQISRKRQIASLSWREKNMHRSFKVALKNNQSRVISEKTSSNSKMISVNGNRAILNKEALDKVLSHPCHCFFF
jgi:hypothetical protein